MLRAAVARTISLAVRYFASSRVAFREPSEDARTVDGEYEPISLVGSSVYRLASNGGDDKRDVSQSGSG